MRFAFIYNHDLDYNGGGGGGETASLVFLSWIKNEARIQNAAQNQAAFYYLSDLVCLSLATSPRGVLHMLTLRCQAETPRRVALPL